MRYFEGVYITDKELNLHFKKERSAIFTMFIHNSHISVLNDRKPMSNSRSYYIVSVFHYNFYNYERYLHSHSTP